MTAERPVTADEQRFQDFLEDLAQARKDDRAYASGAECDRQADREFDQRQATNDSIVDADARRMGYRP